MAGYFYLRNRLSIDIMDITNTTCWTELQKLTNNFSIGYNPAFVDNLKDTLNADGVVYRACIKAPPNELITKKVIGRSGYYFHLTTNNSGVHFIWHDRTENQFIIWGEEYNVKQAIGILNYRIKIVTKREQESRCNRTDPEPASEGVDAESAI